MSTPESPLVLEKTVEAIYTEEMRLKLFETTKVESDFTNPNVNNPLALKHDTQLRGSQGAYVARSGPLSLNRQHPYQRGPYNSQVSYRESYGGYQRGGYSERINTQQYNTPYAQSNQPQAQPLTTLNGTRLNQGSRQVQTGPGQTTDITQYHPNIHYGKQCYACGG